MNTLIVAIAAFIAGSRFFRNQASSSSGRPGSSRARGRLRTLNRKLDQLEEYKRKLYMQLHSPLLSKREKRKGHEYLKKLKQESIGLRKLRNQAVSECRGRP